MYFRIKPFRIICIFGETKAIMSLIIRIDRRTIRLNPDYGIAIIYLEGKRRIEVFSPKPLPKSIAQHFYITSAMLCDDRIGYKDLMYEYSGGCKNLASVVRYLKANEHRGIVVTYLHSPRQIDNSRAPKYFYKYRNPKLPCSECGEMVKFNAIELHYGDDGHAFEECPNCHGIESFDYKLERISDVLKPELA